MTDGPNCFDVIEDLTWEEVFFPDQTATTVAAQDDLWAQNHLTSAEAPDIYVLPQTFHSLPSTWPVPVNYNLCNSPNPLRSAGHTWTEGFSSHGIDIVHPTNRLGSLLAPLASSWTDRSESTSVSAGGSFAYPMSDASFDDYAFSATPPNRQQETTGPGQCYTSPAPETVPRQARAFPDISTASPVATHDLSSFQISDPSIGWENIDLGIVLYQPNLDTHSLVPSEVGSKGRRRRRGRTGPLSPTTRRKAAQMRLVGACESCRRRRAPCDPGTPCRSCVEHFKGDLVAQPCRGKRIVSLAGSLLCGNIFPSPRTLENFLEAGMYGVGPEEVLVSINLGFGPSFPRKVRLVIPVECNRLHHLHVRYVWEPRGETTISRRKMHYQSVFPAILSDTSDLYEWLDQSLSQLVDYHFAFKGFPLFASPLRILKDIYVLYKKTKPPQANILHQALKLLVLVHIGGDTTVDRSDPAVERIMATVLPTAVEDQVTPCFIRAQLGAVMPALAEHLMKEVLNWLEQLSLLRQCANWPVILSTFSVLMMAIESMQFHAAKYAFHATYDGFDHSVPEQAKCGITNEKSIEALLNFYRVCYSGCHARLQEDAAAEVLSTGAVGQLGEANTFIKSLRTAVYNARTYLEEKCHATVSKVDDMSCFFDRLLARLLLQT